MKIVAITCCRLTRQIARSTVAVIIVTAALPLLFTAAAGQQTEQPEQAIEHNELTEHPIRTISSLQRITRHFTFEESETRLLEFPLHFQRYIAASRGFPPFGKMLPSDEDAAEGKWSFLFELAGGSMAARVPSAVLPILPDTEYLIVGKVKTEQLQHARARIAAWFYDRDGNIISESTVHTEAIQTDGRWQQFELTVPGRVSGAVDLGLELQVMQPRQLHHDSIDKEREPLLQDVAGRVWFDDIVIVQLPQLDMFLSTGSRLFNPQQQPELIIEVRDIPGLDVRGNVTIEDLTGEVLLTRSFEAPLYPARAAIPLPLDQPGWFRATLTLKEREVTIASKVLDMALLPATAEMSDRRGPIGLYLPSDFRALSGELPQQARLLGSRAVNVPLWPRQEQPGPTDQFYADVTPVIEGLIDSRMELTFRLDGLPSKLAEAIHLDRSQVVEGLASTPQEQWLPYLQDMFTRFGLEVEQWQIGSASAAPDLSMEVDRTRFSNAAAAIAAVLPQPTIAMSRPFEELSHLPPPAPEESYIPGHVVVVPQQVQPAALDDALDMVASETPLILILESDDQQYGPVKQVVDLTRRVLFAWRAGFDNIMIAPPWSDAEGLDDQRVIAPRPTFVPMMMLNQALAERRFSEEINLGPGVTCWLLTGESHRQPALLAWSDSAELIDHQQGLEIAAMLGPDAVTVTTVLGSRTRVQPDDVGEHRLTIGALPVMIENIDASLLQFRGGLRIEPPLLDARRRVHEHELLIENPWPTTLAGTIQLRSHAAMTINPLSQAFTVAPGATARLPITIHTDRSAPAGDHTVRGTVSLRGMSELTLSVEPVLTIGSNSVHMTAQWSAAANAEGEFRDLIILQRVTNTGDDPFILDSRLLGPGIGQSRSAIGRVEPGTSAVREYRIEDGLVTLAGKQVRLTVSQRDGPLRLNKLLRIPVLPGFKVSETGSEIGR